MREGAVLAVLALSRGVDVGGAELCFVLVGVVELLDSVVRFLAALTVRALLVLQDVLAHFRLIRSKRPPLVFLLIMVVGAPLQIMTIGVNLAGVDLKQRQIQELAETWFTSRRAAPLFLVIILDLVVVLRIVL